jgi:hypothetical protein
MSLIKWFKPTSLQTSWLLIKGGNAPDFGHGILIRSSGVVQFIATDDGSSTTVAEATGTYNVNDWNMVIARYIPGTDEISIRLNSAAFVTETHLNGIFTPSGALMVGGNGSSNLIGSIDFLLHYKKTISDSEADDQWNSGDAQTVAEVNQTGLSNAYTMNNLTGPRPDVIGEADLSDVNTVGRSTGHKLQ